MNVTCMSKELSAALKTVRRAVNPHASLPVLGNVHLCTKGGDIAVSASNLEISIRTRIRAEVIDSGAITVPARTLTDLVALFTDTATLSVHNETATLNIVAGKTKANIKGIPAAEFPFIPDYKDLRSNSDLPTLTFEPADLERALARAVITVATDQGRAILTGVYLHSQEDHLTFASTDGTRLSAQIMPHHCADFPSLIIPAAAIQEALSLLSNETEPVYIVVNENVTQVAFLFPDTHLVTQLLAGDFPDYRAIIPQEHTTTTTTITTSPTALRRALKSALVFSGGHTARSTTWAIEENSLIITGKGEETGDQTSHIRATIVETSKPITEFLLSGRYALDMLQALGGDADQVEICLVASTRPILFRPAGDDSYAHVIMPQSIH